MFEAGDTVLVIAEERAGTIITILPHHCTIKFSDGTLETFASWQLSKRHCTLWEAEDELEGMALFDEELWEKNNA